MHVFHHHHQQWWVTLPVTTQVTGKVEGARTVREEMHENWDSPQDIHFGE